MSADIPEVPWTRMEEGTAADYAVLTAAAEAHTAGALVDNLLTMLALLKGPNLGYQINRYEHSLQSATRAYRADESDDLIVGALGDDNSGGISGSARVFSGFDGSTLYTFNGGGNGDGFGNSVSGAGDVNVGALLHDVGDVFAPANHSDAAGALLAPYVDERTEWIVRHHGVFQGHYYFHHLGGDRDAREIYSGSPHYDACAAFCADYDQNCFDPHYDTLPIEEFEPLLRDVMGRPSRLTS